MNRLRVLKQRANRGEVGVCKLSDGWFVATGRPALGDCSGPHTRREAIQIASRWALPEKADIFSITTNADEAFDAMEAMNAWEKEERELKEKVLSEVRQLVSPVLFSAIRDYIAEEDFLAVSEFGIADSPRGDQQDLGYPFGSYYVWQESVGDSGDSFAGVISIPLPDGRFLQFSYSS